jgi:hypothetical protein
MSDHLRIRAEPVTTSKVNDPGWGVTARQGRHESGPSQGNWKRTFVRGERDSQLPHRYWITLSHVESKYGGNRYSVKSPWKRRPFIRMGSRTSSQGSDISRKSINALQKLL